jgi:hypothetical protein
MRKLLAVFALLFAAACTTPTATDAVIGTAALPAVVGDGPAAFDIKCGQYNYCTFRNVSGQVGTWQFSDWAAWGDAAIGSAVSFSRGMSTHDPVTFETPYTTTITHTVGSAVAVGFVRCDGNWSPHGSMCRKVNK